MWYIILASIVWIASIVVVFKVSDRVDRGFYAFADGLVAAIILVVLGFFAVPATTGIYRGYSEGERTGYVTKISVKGIIWKTYEGEMQIGVGEMAALQEPFKFSITDKTVLKKVSALAGSGKKARLKYIEWLVMPFKIGESGYELIKVDVPLTRKD